MTKLTTRLTFVLALIMSTAPCRAEPSAAEVGMWDSSATPSVYSRPWCILTYLKNARPEAHAHATLTANRSRWPHAHRSLYVDRSAPINRVRALRQLRLATLWRGRESALVLGLVDTRYLGVRLDAAER